MLDLTRRDLVLKGSAAVAAYAVLHSSRAAQAFPSRPGEVVIPWLDQPAPMDDPTVVDQLVWEELDSWITPNEKFFGVTHFGWPVIDAATWTLQIDGLVRRPLSLTLDDIKARARQEETVTLGRSGRGPDRGRHPQRRHDAALRASHVPGGGDEPPQHPGL